MQLLLHYIHLVTLVLFFWNFRLGYPIASTVYPWQPCFELQGSTFTWICFNRTTWSTVGWIRGCRTTDTEDQSISWQNLRWVLGPISSRYWGMTVNGLNLLAFWWSLNGPFQSNVFHAWNKTQDCKRLDSNMIIKILKNMLWKRNWPTFPLMPLPLTPLYPFS